MTGAWPWALAYGAITVGAFSLDVAITEALDGAATPAQEQLLWGAAVVGLASLSLGVAAFVRLLISSSSMLHGRRRIAVATVCVAAVIGVGRVGLFVERLLRHMRLDRDEPLTTGSLSLQAAVAATAAGAVVAFAVHQARVVGRLIAVGDEAHRRIPASMDVGRNGRCPTK